MAGGVDIVIDNYINSKSLLGILHHIIRVPMKFIKSALFFVVLNFIILSIGCGGSYEPDTSSCPPTHVEKGTEVHYSVWADENLKEDSKVAILEALNEWAEKTNHTFAYDLSFIDMSQEPQDTSVPKTIKIYVKDPGPGYLGWTSWQSSTRSSYMFIRPSMNAETFRRVMLHELGHSFALDFNGNAHYEGPYESVMHPSIGEDSLHLCCPELTAFCNEFGCQVDCTNTIPEDNASLEFKELDQWKETRIDGHF